mmetsp:Transcript_16560/g.47165  ORF Transcript_16560/g.47165 Transcript_16560/m.47165 type:complete len:345 (-) Transcript_16560:7524-8558(-)
MPMRSRYDLGVVYVFLLNSLKNFSPVSLIEVWTFTQIFATAVRQTSSFASSSAPNLNEARNWFATAKRALSGQPRYQSIVQQFTREGNCLHLTLRASPTGLIQRQMWSLSQTRCTNVATQLSRDAGTPSASQTGIMSLQILSSSSWGNRFGISPLFKMELMSSSIDSSTTCVSVNKKATFVPSTPVLTMKTLMSSRKSFRPYPREISMDRHGIWAINEAIRVVLCLPLPPTPTSMALPLGCLKIRLILAMCLTASEKNTRFIRVGNDTLYSSSASPSNAVILSMPPSSYLRFSTSTPAFMKSQKRTECSPKIWSALVICPKCLLKSSQAKRSNHCWSSSLMRRS